MGTHPIFESDFDCLTVYVGTMTGVIKLSTPPNKLSLDDSNFFQRRLKDYKSELENIQSANEDEDIVPKSDQSEADLDQGICNLSLDEMTETDKLRHQMFKVNRRLAKLELTQAQLNRRNNGSILVAVLALGASIGLYIRFYL